MFDAILAAGRENGFAVVEVFAEKEEGVHFDLSPLCPSIHRQKTHRLAVRAWAERGDPVGFSLSTADAARARTQFARIRPLPPGPGKGAAVHLPTAVREVRCDIHDPAFEAFAADPVAELRSRISESLISFPGLKLVAARVSKTRQKRYLANSGGFAGKYRRTRFTLSITLRLDQRVLEVGETRVYGSGLDPENLVARAHHLLEAQDGGEASFSGSELPLLLAPEAAVVLLRAFSRFCRLDLPTEGDRWVASPAVTIADHAALDGQVGSYPFDDEGVPGGETEIVRKGMMATRVNNLETAASGNRKPTGNGVRRGDPVFPRIGFSNLFIKPSVIPLDRLLAAVPAGVLVSSLRPQAVDPAIGAMTCVAHGFELAGGEIGRAVRFQLVAVPRTVFLRIERVSRDLKFFCQDPNLGAPYMLAPARILGAARLQL